MGVVHFWNYQRPSAPKKNVVSAQGRTPYKMRCSSVGYSQGRVARERNMGLSVSRPLVVVIGRTFCSVGTLAVVVRVVCQDKSFAGLVPACSPRVVKMCILFASSPLISRASKMFSRRFVARKSVSEQMRFCVFGGRRLFCVGKHDFSSLVDWPLFLLP